MDKNISTYYNGKYNTYVGARYVPIFADPIEWDKSKPYEPLTIVTYQGGSYTSKTFVPVNADINDTTYWVMTGNYNAQVEAYRQEVLDYKNTVDTLAENYDAILADVANIKSKTLSVKYGNNTVIFSEGIGDNDE